MDQKTRPEKLPDPMGMIARIRSRLPRNCAVRLSPFCEIVISMRMQSVPYRDIEEWLIKQGDEFRISAPTIWRNFQQTKLHVELPYAEELAEQWGGRIDLNVVRELSGQILAQRKRIDRMQRQEEDKQRTSPAYFNRYLRGERETLVMMLRTLHTMLELPDEAAQRMAEAEKAATPFELTEIPEDVMSLLKDAILSGELKIRESSIDSAESPN